jgi:hypothetical protein
MLQILTLLICRIDLNQRRVAGFADAGLEAAI